MPSSFFWMFALLAALFIIVRRFLRGSSTLTEYKTQQDELLKKMQEENTAIHLSDEEALVPVLAALRDINLPPHMEMRMTLHRSGAGVHIVSGSEVLLAITLAYSRVAPPANMDGRRFTNGAWHLRLDYHAKSGQDAEAVVYSPEDASEYFDELAPFATRVETLIRSLHDRPF